MQKNQKRKHGFTLVELSIVIAVIAILIAVLVPTFTALIDKANKTNDNSLVKNLNTGLSTDEAINGKPSTIDEALVAAEGAGYKVENLTPTSDGTLIVWNEVDNEFVYVEADLVNGNLVEVDGEALTTDSCNIWIITKSYDSTYADFSQYISGTLAENTTLEVKAGISVGNNTNINVTYKPDSTAAKTVTFVTNGGTLELDDEGATVSHYGSATTVTITAVDKVASYHLYGTVTGNINVEYGHIVVESNASVGEVEVASTATTVSIVTKSNSTVVAVVDNSGNASLTVESGSDFGVAVGFESSNVSGTTSVSKDTYESYEARAGLNYYSTFAEAVTAAKSSGEAVTLLNDVTLTASGNYSSELYLSSGSLTIDLNGNTIACGSITYPVYIASGATLTINDSKDSGVIKTAGTYGVYAAGTLNFNGGTIESSASGATVYVCGIINTTGGSIIHTGDTGLWLYQAQSANLEKLTVTMKYTSWGYGIYCSSCTGAITMTNVTIGTGDLEKGEGKYCCGVALLTYSSLTMTDCNVTSYGWYCVANNGADSAVSLTISGGTYTAEDCTAIYLPNYNAIVSISNAEITGSTGIEIRGGYLTLNNCTVAGTNDSYSYQSNNGGNTVYGPALAISQHTTKQVIQVTINGGTYTAENAPAITQNNLNSGSDEDIAKITLTISGATIEGNSTEYDDIYLENKDKINYSYAK
ncbi:MAG: prepilin-type N-terminal cleavage/methylation domain-containing protein [Clostridia bacterium]|nr:prepilin-type N-terminal cleavage/methylation domain-containing protein [Clostridia bacterium]